MKRSSHPADEGIRRLDRREFIAAAVALTTGAMLPRALCAADPHDSAAGFVAVLSDADAGARLGATYLAAHPQEADAAVLVARLRQALQEQSPRFALDPAALGPRLIELVQQEYVRAPLVRVDGWLLAPSEARLYALAALSRAA